jgi:hypothetical protein
MIRYIRIADAVSRYMADTLPPAMVRQVVRHRELTFWAAATVATVLVIAPEAHVALEAFKAIH